MIATAKFKRAHDRAVAARPYTDRLRRLISQLSAAAGEFRHPLLEQRESKNAALIVVTSNRGLCGGYNTNVLRQVAAFRREAEERNLPVEIHACGKKAIVALRYQRVKPAAAHTDFEDNPSFERVDALVAPLMERYEAGALDEVHVAYTKFLSAGRQEATVEQVLPLKPPEAEEAAAEYIFHPDVQSILFDLLPRSVRVHMFQAFLDAAVSEQTARMVAMKSATDNAQEMIRALGLRYNRSRQTQITTELSEIIGGAAALE
jgi:F-type H+-transporting ATPase subunit gamma